MALGMGLLYVPRRGVFLMSEIPLYDGIFQPIVWSRRVCDLISP